MLPAPKLLPLASVPELEGVFSYIIEHYGYSGWGCLVYWVDDSCLFKFSDWEGHELSVEQIPSKIASEYVPKLATAIKLAGVRQAMLFFSQDLLLVDVQVALDKFLGPGMIIDLFQKMVPVLKRLDLKILSAEELAALPKGVIIKPSRFRTVVRDDKLLPCYVET